MKLLLHPLMLALPLLVRARALTDDSKADHFSTSQSSVASRVSNVFDNTQVPQEIECRLVHLSHDQCAFVKLNCVEQESGFLSYLTFYFCTLSTLKPLGFSLLSLWLLVLFSTIGVTASDYFSVNLSTISSLLRLSESVTGVTFLAFGNGSPDVFSTFAAMRSGSGSLAIGELIGAASFISAVVAGSMALVRPFEVARKSFVRDVGCFILATGFSMAFLADGRLQFWECVVMISFYGLYVLLITVWQWKSTRKRLVVDRESHARSHFRAPGSEEESLTVESEHSYGITEYHREETVPLLQHDVHPEDGPRAFATAESHDSNQSQSRRISDFDPSMRLHRPLIGVRKLSERSIRPSLVGAVEFSAFISSLRSSLERPNVITSHRRHSEDLSSSRLRHNNEPLEFESIGPDTGSTQHVSVDTQPNLYGSTTQRRRAVSTNILDEPTDDSLNLKFHNITTGNNLQIELKHPELEAPHLRGTETESRGLEASSRRAYSGASSSDSAIGSRDLMSQPLPRSCSPSNLQSSEGVYLHVGSRSPAKPGNEIDTLVSQSGIAVQQSALRPALEAPESSGEIQNMCPSSKQQMKFWHRLWNSESANVVISTLFPTLQYWTEKNFWQKVLAVSTVPSVFLLTVTLPVVESANPELRLGETINASVPIITVSNVFDNDGQMHGPNPDTARESSIPQIHEQLESYDDVNDQGYLSSHGLSLPSTNHGDRWLTLIQVAIAPFLVALVVWASFGHSQSPRTQFLWLACACVSSLLLLLVVLSMRNSSDNPRYQGFLCFLGFIIGVIWISTIANEVVGILKAFGIILGISEAILGLTIFAVGNSLGDLVANITISKLGYPRMALSACWGGPMLNILIGVGASGLFMTIKGKDSQGSDRSDASSIAPYELEISKTLIISGVTLLLSLVGIMIAVPLNRWTMDRKIGIALVATWALLHNYL